MTKDKPADKQENKFQLSKWFSHEILLLTITIVLVVTFGGIAIALEKPLGSLKGQISIEKEGFNLSTYDVSQNKVYAIAIGPQRQDTPSIERGVWVQNDGQFQINNLPIGEYTVRVRAPGFATFNKYDLLIEEGKTSLVKDINLSILRPSVSIASQCRVFTSDEKPNFWINSSGSTKAIIKIYRKDIASILKKPINQANLGFAEIGSSLNIYKPQKDPQEFFAKEKPIEILERKLESDYTDWARAEFKLSKPLPKGDYLAVVEAFNLQGKKDWSILWFSVSDLGLIIKQAPEKTLVRAIDLRTLQPRAGTDIQIVDREGNAALLAKSATAKNGFAELKPLTNLSENYTHTLLALGLSREDKAYGGISFWKGNQSTYETYFYTERPIYRLGQSVYYKGIVRLSTSDGFKTPQANLPVSAEYSDPNGNKTGTASLRSSSHGTFNGVFEIPSDGKTGAYEISFKYPDGSTGYGNFEVAEYRKPEYQVEVIPLKERIVAGSTMKARIKATYYFGAPVVNAKIHYSVYSSEDWQTRYKLMARPDCYSYYDDWSEEDDYHDYGYSGDYITEGYATTNESGEAIIEVKTEPNREVNDSPYDSNFIDKRFKIQAEVTDISRMSVIGNGFEPVTAGAFTLFVEPKSYVFKKDEAIDARVSAVDYDGKAVQNQKVDLKLIRWKYDIKRGSYKTEIIDTIKNLQTDSKGHIEARFDQHLKKSFASINFSKNLIETDTYYIVAQASDKNGNNIKQQNSIWIASPQSPYIKALAEEASSQPLEIKLDKKVYRPGDTLKAMISGPVTGREGAEAIVSIEGEKLYEYQVIKFDATAKLVEIPIKPSFSPNVYISVTLVDKKHQLYTQTEIVKVSPENHFLNLDIKTDKEKYKPGENVNYTIKATYSDGKPAANTEVSLGVVDESIYAIRPEVAEDIRKFFYNRKYNSVVTLSSFPEEYSGGPDKVEPRLRKDFRDTAAWLPAIITDKDGIAKASIKLPNNITSWRATVRAISQETDIGAGTQNIIATQDLFIRLALPRFYTQWDEANITAIVHNYSDEEQSVDLSLSVPEQFETKDKLNQNLQIKSQEAKRYTLPVKVIGYGEALISAKAIPNESSQNNSLDLAGDAIERKIPIHYLGFEDFISKSGVIKNQSESIDFDLNGPWNDEEKELAVKKALYNLSLAASSIGLVTNGLDSLIDYPYGCTEQTMGKLMPSIIAIKLNKQLGVNLSEESKKKFAKVYDQSILKLKENHNEDGGWGWWRFDTSNLYLTSYVLEGLYELKETGFAVEPEMIDSGIKFIQTAQTNLYNQLNDPKLAIDSESQIEGLLIDLAYSDYILSLYNKNIKAEKDIKNKQPNQKIEQYLLSKVNSPFIYKNSKTELSKNTVGNTPEFLSFLALSLSNRGFKDQANQIYQKLLSIKNKSNDWNHSPEMLKRLGKKYDYSYQFTGTESTALALRAILAIDSENKDLIELVKSAILRQRGKDGWENTKTTAQVLRALLLEELLNKQNNAQNNALPDSGSAADFKVKTNLPDIADLANLNNTSADTNKSIWSELVFNKENIYSPEKKYSANLDKLLKKLNEAKENQENENKIALSKDGIGRLYYHSLLSFIKPLKPGDKVETKSIPEGIKITRSFYKLVPKPIGKDGSIHFVTRPILGQVKAGETVLMKINVNTPIDLPYILLEAALPSGGEVVSNDPREDLMQGEENTGFGGDWGEWWWTHQDILDHKIAYFLTNLHAGKSELHAMVRMEMPGKFQLNPVQLQGMYTDKIKAYSGLDSIKVVE